MQFDVLARFQLDAPAVSCDRYGCGHINETYLVVTESGRRYILQKISNRAFPDVAGLQENIAAVSNPKQIKTIILLDIKSPAIKAFSERLWYIPAVAYLVYFQEKLLSFISLDGKSDTNISTEIGRIYYRRCICKHV